MPKLCEAFIETRVQQLAGGLGEFVEGESRELEWNWENTENHINLGIDREIDRQLGAYLDLPVEWPVLAPPSASLLPPLISSLR